MRRMCTVLLLVALSMPGIVGPAWAHTRLIGSSPAEGASLPVAPQQLQLTFNEPVQARFSTITVTGPDSAQWTLGQLAVHSTVVTAPVRQAGPVGPYTIDYRVLSADGHPVGGTVRFALTGPVSATATAPRQTLPSAMSIPAPHATAADHGGSPVWLWIIGVVVLLGIGLIIALRLGRSPDS